jgi:hypothetical protein
MALKDLTACIESHLIERIGELTEPAANRGNHAAFLKHATANIALMRRSAAHLPPKGEDCARRDDTVVESGGGEPKVLNLAALIPILGRSRIGP